MKQNLPSDNEIEKTVNDAIDYVKSIFLNMEIEVDSKMYKPILKHNMNKDQDEKSESDEEPGNKQNNLVILIIQ